MKKHPPRRAKLTVRPAHRLLSPPFLFVSSSSSSSSPCSEPFPVRNRSKRAGGVANRGCLLHGRPKTAREGGSGARTIDRPPTVVVVVTRVKRDRHANNVGLPPTRARDDRGRESAGTIDT